MTEIKRKIHVIGINSFEFEELPKKIQKIFIETDNIAIPDSYFSSVKVWEENSKSKKNFFSSKSNNKLFNWLKSQKTDAVLISRGDPLWFGIGRILLENFRKEELCFYPSNTSIQLAFSKLKAPWQETTFVSIHGRDSTKLIKALKSKPSSLTILTDSNKKGVEIIQKNLFELNINTNYDFWLFEEIGFKNEKIRKLNISEKLPSDISNINIVVLLKKSEDNKAKNLPLFGLNDDTFKTFQDRPNLLTKREIRVQILADLELPENGLICDIGAGCGSIGLEALKLSPNLQLLCIDKKIGSKSLILENAKRLGVKPKYVFEEDIKNTLKKSNINYLKNANRVIIGGCDKETKIILISKLSQTMKSGDIIVIPIIDISTLRELKEELEKNKFFTSLNLIQTYKTLSIAEGIRLDPNNPVFLLKGKK